MKVEILTNGEFYDVVRSLNVETKCAYKCPEDIYGEHPYYEIWEVEKSDIQKIETACMFEDVLFCSTGESYRGTPCSFLTVRGNFMIGYETKDYEEKYDCFTDYCKYGLDVSDSQQLYTVAINLAKTNGVSLSKFFTQYEG